MAKWLRETGHPRGAAVDVQVMYDLSVEWYRGRMDEAWMPLSSDEAAGLFARHGLTGPFWSFGQEPLSAGRSRCPRN